MDLSSLPEAQQQQLQQLHQQFQEHQLQKQQEQQQQEQQHQQELASQSYYASQVQSYDQSNQGYDQSYQAYDQSNQGYDQSTQGYYYPYHHYPQHHQEQQQQQHYPYYHSDYTNAYQTQTLAQPQSQPSQPDVQPPGISAPPETSSQALAAIPGQGQLQQHNAYYPPQGVSESQQQQNPSAYPVPSGLNPAAAAAVAALSQLNQFAGTMDAAERAMAGMHDRQWQPKNGGYGPMPPHMYPQGGYHYGPYPVREGGRGGGKPYRGGGRRGGGTSRGGRGNFGARHPRQDGSAPNLRGRGRGRGRGRRVPPHDGSSIPYPIDTPSEPVSASANEEAEQSAAEHGDAPETALVSSSATTPGQAPGSTVSQGKAASTRRPPQIAWCELCRVDCTSLEILEQHKNGKKHKKNLQRFEEQQPGRSTLSVPIPMPVVTHMPIPKDASAPAPVSTSAATATPLSTSAATAAPLSTSVSTVAPSPELTPIPEPLPTSIPAPNLLVDAQNEQETLAEGKSEVTKQDENGQGDEIVNQPAPENLSTEADENIMEIEHQTDIQQQPDISEAEPSEAIARKRRMDRFDARKRAANRKVRGGRGSKRMRMVERPSRQVEPPKEVAPIICELCNVKCDTRAVFDCHLAGKKHISKLKRFQGHQAIYGPVGLQALYPPNPNTHPTFIPHQQPMYMPQRSFHPMMAYGRPQGHHVATGSATRFPQVNPGISQVTLSVPPEGQQQAGPVPQEQAVLSKSGISFSDYAGNTSHPPQDSVVQLTANTAAVSMNLQASPAVPIPESGTSSSENATLPGIQVQPEQSSV